MCVSICGWLPSGGVKVVCIFNAVASDISAEDVTAFAGTCAQRHAAMLPVATVHGAFKDWKRLPAYKAAF